MSSAQNMIAQAPRQGDHAAAPAGSNNAHGQNNGQNTKNMFEVPPIVEDAMHDLRYRCGKLLGKGGFAQCYEFENLTIGGLYAAKVTTRASLSRRKYYDKFVSEVRIHRGLNHNCIVRVHSVFKDQLNYYIIMDKCEGGTLSDLIRSRKFLTEPESRYYFVNLIDAIEYLHSLHIIHRDLKPSNVFLTQRLIPKIGDFGLAAQLHDPEEKRQTMCGTPNYLAPEIIYSHICRRQRAGREPDVNIDNEACLLAERRLPQCAGDGHSYGVDIWSLGIVLYTLCFGHPPFESTDIKSTYKRIITGEVSFPSNIRSTHDLRDLIRKMLNVDPRARITIEQIRKHPWVNPNLYFIPPSLPASIRYEAPDMPNQINSGAGAQGQGTGQSVGQGAGQGVGSNVSQNQQATNATPATDSKGSAKGTDGNEGNPQGIPDHNVEPSADNENNNAVGEGERDDSIIDDNQENAPAQTPLFIDPKAPTPKTSSQFDRMFPSVQDPVHVISWVDYTNRYGFGYQLSNGIVGVMFNDQSTGVISARGKYIEYYESPIQTHPVVCTTREAEAGAIPAKKYKLIIYFRDYLESRSIQPVSLESRPQENKYAGRLLYVKLWRMVSQSTLAIRLSNKSFQVNLFDHTKIIVTSKTISYINESRKIKTYPSEYLKWPQFEHKEIRSRLAYVKKISDLCK